MKNINKRMIVFIAISFIFLVPISFIKPSNTEYWWFAYLSFTLMILNSRMFHLMGISFLMGLILSQVMIAFNLVEIANLTSNISFIGLILFLVVSWLNR